MNPAESLPAKALVAREFKIDKKAGKTPVFLRKFIIFTSAGKEKACLFLSQTF